MPLSYRLAWAVYTGIILGVSLALINPAPAPLANDAGETMAQYATMSACENVRDDLGHTADDYRCE